MTKLIANPTRLWNRSGRYYWASVAEASAPGVTTVVRVSNFPDAIANELANGYACEIDAVFNVYDLTEDTAKSKEGKCVYAKLK